MFWKNLEKKKGSRRGEKKNKEILLHQKIIGVLKLRMVSLVGHSAWEWGEMQETQL